MKVVHFLDLETMPIFEQLQLEEALLRGTSQNFCILSRGSTRAIVMGISGKAKELLNIPKVQQDQVPVIQRFSGGGTVIVDKETLFLTFIFAKDLLPVHPFPEPILRWSAQLYQNSWQIPHFHLIENDYAIGPKKCGGNAQYIQKDRWLHHTSFLWDYQDENMNYLTLPSKRPIYRENRPHTDFLCRLKEHSTSKETLINQLKTELEKQVHLVPIERNALHWNPHRQSVQFITSFA
jgi:lipoate-protein ligase A